MVEKYKRNNGTCCAGLDPLDAAFFSWHQCMEVITTVKLPPMGAPSWLCNGLILGHS